MPILLTEQGCASSVAVRTSLNHDLELNFPQAHSLSLSDHILLHHDEHMEFLSRWLGASYAPKKPAPKVNDAQSRLLRFNRILSSIGQLCNQKRNLARETTTLNELQDLFNRLTQVIRDESRAPQPHACVQLAASQQVYALVNRAASISYHQGCIHSAVALMSALVDSEEESFLKSRGFAKSLTRLVTKVIDNEEIELQPDTESLILELLFTIAAKIRLQPDILPSWFTLSRRAELDLGDEKTRASFGFTRAQDFPLCYILVDRIYKEGRTGDFARTALLYLFEATSKSSDLAVYMVESSICTLMGSGLGALYSQLSRELSIIHPDALLPPVLAMSDYDTRQTKATVESAFNDAHIAHISTFVSYIFFWTDILDHVKRSDVKQALLDNFEILFIQQLLYPSILQSSDVDAGSATAILTYIEAIVSAIEHPALIDTILSYILAIDNKSSATRLPEARGIDTDEDIPTLQRRESLLAMTQSGNLEDIVEPTLFTLVDLILNNLSSANAQAVFAALRLSATILRRQSSYAIGTLLKVTPPVINLPKRRVGIVAIELDHYMQLASRVSNRGLEIALGALVDDTRLQMEGSKTVAVVTPTEHLMLSLADGTFLPQLMSMLSGWFTNGVEVNLALSQTLVAIARLPQIRLESWISLPASLPAAEGSVRSRPWQQYLDSDEMAAFVAIKRGYARPSWPVEGVPTLYDALDSLVTQFEAVRSTVANMDSLMRSRKLMLASGTSEGPDMAPSLPPTPLASRHPSFSIKEAQTLQSPSKSVSLASGGGEAHKQGQGDGQSSSSLGPSADDSSDQPRTVNTPSMQARSELSQPRLRAHQIFRPPPAETPSTTDVLMSQIPFSSPGQGGNLVTRSASLNHVLTNSVILQEFILEVVAVLHVRASLFADIELDTS